MKELTDLNIEYQEQITGNKNSGLLVKTKSGYEGRTYHKDNLVNGKQPVYIDKDGKSTRMLCRPETLKIIGYID